MKYSQNSKGSSDHTRVYDLGGFHVDARKRLLLNANGEPIALTPKVFDLLLYLVENRGRVVEKDELMSSIWPDAIVEEGNLSQNISVLRRVLGEKRGEHKYVATIPGRGYKFVAEVAASGSGEDLGTQSAPTATRRKVVVATVAAVLAIVLLVLVAGSYYFNRETVSSANQQPRTIAVLPFRSIVAEHRDEVLEIGMTDTLIARLGGISGLTVRPLSSVRYFSDDRADPLLAGSTLNVDAVLEGSVQRWGQRLRTNVRLLSVSDGGTIWSATFDENGTDIFAIQDAITSKVAESLRLQLRPERVHKPPQSTSDVEAYQLYMLGRYHSLKLTAPEVGKGIEYYRKAIEKDPTYALAYAAMADAYRTLPINSDVPPKEALVVAKVNAQRALEIDEDLADAHVVLGWVESWYDWDSSASEREFKTALQIDPDSADAHRGYSGLLSVMGRHDEAVMEMRRARELDPLSLVTNALEGQTLFYAGRDDEAVDRLQKTLEIDSNFWIAHINLAKVYLRQERWDDALAALEKADINSGGHSEVLSLKGYALARAGRSEDARKTADDLIERSRKNYVPPYNLAMIFNGLGEFDEAFRWLDEAVKDRDVRMRLLNIDHKWSSMRNDPRWEALLVRANSEG